VFGDSLKPISRRDAGVEPTGTYLRRGEERSTGFSAGQAVSAFAFAFAFAFIFYLLSFIFYL
jgi:hypothetical protein